MKTTDLQEPELSQMTNLQISEVEADVFWCLNKLISDI